MTAARPIRGLNCDMRTLEAACADLGLNVADYRAARGEACHRCWRCLNESGATIGGLPVTSTRMIVCEHCGNKRCPHSTDHRLACTGSNELGQPGSRYTGRQPERSAM